MTRCTWCLPAGSRPLAGSSSTSSRGCGEQRGGQPEPLAHPQREAPDPVVGDVGEPDLLQRVVDAGRATGVVPAQ